jgi:hypothetical protein
MVRDATMFMEGIPGGYHKHIGARVSPYHSPHATCV